MSELGTARRLLVTNHHSICDRSTPSPDPPTDTRGESQGPPDAHFPVEHGFGYRDELVLVAFLRRVFLTGSGGLSRTRPGSGPWSAPRASLF